MIAIGADGKKLTLEASKTSAPVPVEITKLELGDDVLVATNGNDPTLLARAVVTEIERTA